MSIAFFDLDRTLVDVNTASLWIKRELRSGHITRTQAAKAASWVLLYELGFARIEQVIERAIAALKDAPERDIIERTDAFFAEEVAARVRPGVRAALEEHRAAGDKLVLLSSTSVYLSRPICQVLGLDDSLCNSFELVDGVFTGRPNLPLCYGPGKVDHALAFAARLDVPLEACAFYTDSYSDLPMLERVGRPVCVAPDPRLRRLAKKRGWTVLDWGLSNA